MCVYTNGDLVPAHLIIWMVQLVASMNVATIQGQKYHIAGIFREATGLAFSLSQLRFCRNTSATKVPPCLGPHQVMALHIVMELMFSLPLTKSGHYKAARYAGAIGIK